MINDKGARWLEERGFDLTNVIARSDLFTTSKPGGEPSNDEAADWMAFPYREDGEIVNTKYRRLSQKDFAQTKGGKQVLWNRDAIRDPGLQDYPLIITEGEMDALAAMEAGFPRVVSVPGGAPDQPGHKRHEYIDEAWNDLREVGTIILATDSDEAGHALQQDLIARFGRPKCKTIKYPKGCKDLGDALRLYGVKGVRAALDTAMFYPMEGPVSLSQLPDQPPLRAYKLRSLGRDFENHVGICRGHLSIWTGRANRGKSAVMRAVSHALVREHGWRVAVGSWEDDPRRDYEPEMIRVLCNGYPQDEERLQQARQWLDDHFKFLMPPQEGAPTIAYTLEQMEAAVRRFGCQFIVLDPWTEFDLELGPGLSETEAVKMYLGAFRRFAERFNCHVAIIAHPRKPPDFGGTHKMPDGYDISGSAHFTNRCHLGVTVESDQDTDGLTKVRVWKSKYRQIMGKTGDFHLFFTDESRRFSEISWQDVKELKGLEDAA